MPLEMKDKLQQCLISTGFNFTSLLVIKIHLLLARPKILCSLCFANFTFLTQGPAPGVFKEQSWSTYTFSLVCKGLFLYGTCHLHFQLTSQTCLSGHTETKQTQTLDMVVNVIYRSGNQSLQKVHSTQNTPFVCMHYYCWEQSIVPWWNFSPLSSMVLKKTSVLFLSMIKKIFVKSDSFSVPLFFTVILPFSCSLELLALIK